MPENSLRVVARIKARPDTIDDVRRLLSGLIEPTRQEPGCVKYELLQNRQDPTDFTFVEEWNGDSAFNNHFTTDHIQAALPQLAGIAAEEADIRTYSVIS